MYSTGGKRKARDDAGDDAEEQWYDTCIDNDTHTHIPHACPSNHDRENDDTATPSNPQPTGGGRKKAKQQKQRVNTSVYITGLPDDASEAELAHVFRKCGLIKEDEEGHPRVKVYRDKESGRYGEWVVGGWADKGVMTCTHEMYNAEIVDLYMLCICNVWLHCMGVQ